MHTSSTRTEFLRLRVQGLSLASIARRLGVSKPTLIKWNRASQPEIAAQSAADRQHVQQKVTATATQEISDLTRRLTGLKQELFSRAIREISTPNLEALAGELRQRLDFLQGATTGSPGGQQAASQTDGRCAPVCAAANSPIENQNSKIENAIPCPTEPIRTPKN